MNLQAIPEPQVVQSRGPEPVSGIRGWTVQLQAPREGCPAAHGSAKDIHRGDGAYYA